MQQDSRPKAISLYKINRHLGRKIAFHLCTHRAGHVHSMHIAYMHVARQRQPVLSDPSNKCMASIEHPSRRFKPPKAEKKNHFLAKNIRGPGYRRRPTPSPCPRLEIPLAPHRVGAGVPLEVECHMPKPQNHNSFLSR